MLTSSASSSARPRYLRATATTRRRLARTIRCLTVTAAARSRSNSSISARPGRSGSRPAQCPLGQRLQVVHLAEQVRLLLARQEGDFTEAVHLRTRALGGRGPSCDLGRWRSGHLGEDRVAGAGVVEAGVSNVLDPRRQRAADARPAGQAPAVRQGPIGPGGAVEHADISCCVTHGIPLIIRRASRAGCARGGRGAAGAGRRRRGRGTGPVAEPEEAGEPPPALAGVPLLPGTVPGPSSPGPVHRRHLRGRCRCVSRGTCKTCLGKAFGREQRSRSGGPGPSSPRSHRSSVRFPAHTLPGRDRWTTNPIEWP